MGDSLGFHIIFVLFSLTLPILVCWFEWIGMRKKDKAYTNVAKFWSKIMTLIVVAGVISGTVIALQMTLIWPGILKFGGEVIGLPFMLETYAFLVEATFLGLYMTTWNNPKVPPMLHWFFGIMTAIGATASAFAITSVNAWMNLPTGFKIVGGKISDIDVLGAMFSQTSLITFAHSMPGYYLAAALTVAGAYALKLMRVRKQNRSDSTYKMDRIIIRNLVGFAAVMIIFSGITAHFTGQYLAEHEPVKLAAIELQYKTEDHAPFVYGGVAGLNDTIQGPHISVPNLLSILSGYSADTVVQGLDRTPVDERPPLYVHLLFTIKLLLVGALVVIAFGYLALRRWKPAWAQNRGTLILVGISGFVAIVVIELGWMLTEIGRQPWAVRGYVTTEQAITTHDVGLLGLIFPTAFLALGIVTALALRKIIIAENRKSAKVEK
jgi:cytochrome d ubiquinol oxidase subunit I